ncbi:MAG: 50S ribosomal protein L25 [Peptostreptococcaceae bacterium]
MSTLELKIRDKNIPNSAKKARKTGNIPGVLYGKSINNFMFEVGDLDLGHEIASTGEYGIIEVLLNGENHKALIKEVQRDPATNKIIHLDLEELKGKEKIISSVPIHYVGEEYINRRGTVLQKEKDSVKIECSVDSLPKYINLNVGLGAVGSVYKLGDLEVASEISILDDLNSVIASVSYERKTVSDDMDLAEEVVE